MSHLQESPQTIYFSGICGTAMASLAVLLKQRGLQIKGSDSNIYPPMSTFLQEHQIPILEGYEASHLTPRPDLVVIGNALSRGNPEVEAVMAQGIPYISMAELLKEYFIRGKTSIVVTGTHGKTTTTSLLAWVFYSAGQAPGFMIGGIAENFGASCQEAKGQFFITEGDEYDTAFFDKRSKFFHYLPHQLLLNNIEFDHADIFDSLEDILKAFRLLLRLVPKNGLIVANGDNENVLKTIKQAFTPCVTFGVDSSCDVQVSKICSLEKGMSFQMEWKGKGEYRFTLPLLGDYNVMNATAVAVLAMYNGITSEQIQAAFSTFQGVKRRQELRGIRKGIYIYDDFAHHPTAVKKTIEALRQKHPRQRLIAVFEPRSNTSVLKIHQEELTHAFEDADEILLSFPHRYERLSVEQRLDVAQIIKELQADNKSAKSFHSGNEIAQYLIQNAREGDVILVMSNGKFDNIHVQLLEGLY
ncbi:UDP-N-acetylmuramate:L-alanyl-gamma-D-glutamyl-meso-diaminopimelate ligase [Deltaproteobacteria bacterium TL4]